MCHRLLSASPSLSQGPVASLPWLRRSWVSQYQHQGSCRSRKGGVSMAHPPIMLHKPPPGPGMGLWAPLCPKEQAPGMGRPHLVPTTSFPHTGRHQAH